jgi:hypothetical protein
MRSDRRQTNAIYVNILLFVLFGLLLWWCLDQYIQPTDSTQKKDLMQAWGFIIAGVAGGVGIYFTWQNLQQGKEEQITERFTPAIDQLGETDQEGKPKLEIRLGGIYALERIAGDSPERDYIPVMEVLTAYVRENAPYSPEESEKNNASKPQERSSRLEPATDIRAIMHAIRRLHVSRIHEQEGLPERYLNRFTVDLHQTNLQGAYLYGANFRGAYLYGANLQEAHLYGANLQYANLEEANLEGAKFFSSASDKDELEGAYLGAANLRGADLSGADLSNTLTLTQEQINKAEGDAATKLPDHLRHPDHWRKGDNEQPS